MQRRSRRCSRTVGIITYHARANTQKFRSSNFNRKAKTVILFPFTSLANATYASVGDIRFLHAYTALALPLCFCPAHHHCIMAGDQPQSINNNLNTDVDRERTGDQCQKKENEERETRQHNRASRQAVYSGKEAKVQPEKMPEDLRSTEKQPCNHPKFPYHPCHSPIS
ncbi:hypothetical protein HOLleu_18440 [Holothuria leucospilota]|uniref:Uncharacterized protein n=1 Tax=Holothuria leucospilota TaxID=206669 RepID=A0A9Q1H9V6_HOLLE|nr:hypothetical protein HOLleu_18440 [Holothuria leucospilota]